MAGQLWYAIVDYPLSQSIENDENVTQTNDTVSIISNDRSRCVISFPNTYSFLHKNYAIFTSAQSMLSFQTKDPKTWDPNAVYDPPKDQDGRPIVAPTFEDTQGLTTVWKGHLYTAPPGTLSFFDVEVTSELMLRGGWYEIIDLANITVGDYIEISVIDKNDILGYFALYGLTVGVDILELKKFVRTEYINPDPKGIPDFTSAGASPITAGLFMRVSFMNTGTNSIRFKITEKYHEI